MSNTHTERERAGGAGRIETQERKGDREEKGEEGKRGGREDVLLPLALSRQEARRDNGKGTSADQC